MVKSYVPDDSELDLLLDKPPEFDLNAVKTHTLSRIAPASPRRHKPLRYLLIAAVICALSVSTLATDYALGGPITRTLKLQKPVALPEAPPIEEAAPTPEPPAPEPLPEPEPVPEPPELDQQVASALQVTEPQAQSLRPAVQNVDRSVIDQDVRMTVLQTLGDAQCLYVKLRFDFPETTPASENLEFDQFDLIIEGVDGYGWQETVLERDERSITYLLRIHLSGNESLNGRTATISVKDYGTPHQYTENEVLQMAGNAGVPYTSIVYPDGTVLRDPDEATLAALPPKIAPLILYSEGFTVSRRADGSNVVTYDGNHGDQIFDAYLAPDFDPVIPGQWEQSWTISYQDLSRHWEGTVALDAPCLTLTDIRLSPLSWNLQITIRELAGEELVTGWTYDRLHIQLLRRDGSLAELPKHQRSGWVDQQSDGAYILSYLTEGGSFEQPLDLTDIAGLVVNGREILLP